MKAPLYLTDPLFSCYVDNPLVRENAFKKMPPDRAPLPSFAEARDLLPVPMWEGHQAHIDCYWRAWEIAFGNLRPATPENGFVAPLIDTAFNGHLFLWDSVFILMFGRYGSRAFNFQRTLDDLYVKQHRDGFICREIDIADGMDCFHRHDPVSTGPNVFAWSEWEYYRNFADRQRLANVYPVLLAYHRWMRDYRTWPDGSYWSCGWACGMDNQPRVPAGYNPAFSPAHQAWVDSCFQAIISAKYLLQMGKELGRDDDRQRLTDEIELLTRLVNERMWDEKTGYYYDLRRDGSRNVCQTVGAYWGLLADVIPSDRIKRFIAPLDDEKKFKRPHRVPSLPADDPAYAAHGNYWCGGVWPMTNYMVLAGLTRTGYDALAADIARSHVDNVTAVYQSTNTLWENYSPEKPAPGNPARPDFVGFSGIGPIAVLFEYVFGIRPDAPSRRLVWDVRLLEAHGVQRYPFGRDGVLTLQCARRNSQSEKPDVTITSTVPLEVELRWAAGRETHTVRPTE